MSHLFADLSQWFEKYSSVHPIRALFLGGFSLFLLFGLGALIFCLVLNAWLNRSKRKEDSRREEAADTRRQRASWSAEAWERSARRAELKEVRRETQELQQERRRKEQKAAALMQRGRARRAARASISEIQQDMRRAEEARRTASAAQAQVPAAPPGHSPMVPHLTDTQIDALALKANRRIGGLPDRERDRAWGEWTEEIKRAHGPLVAGEVAQRAAHLRGLGDG